MKGKLQLLAVLAAWLVLPGSAAAQWANEYYVDCTNGSDNNDGRSAATAWKTIAKAAATVRGPVFVHVRNGPCLIDEVLFPEGISGEPGADCATPSPGCSVFRGENASGTAAPIAVQRAGSRRDGFILRRNVRNVRFEYFDFLPRGTSEFNDAVIVRGTASNLYFKNIRILGGASTAGFQLNAGYSSETPGLFDVVVDSCVVQDVGQKAFRVETGRTCALKQGARCNTDQECGGDGPCGEAEAWNIRFVRSFALNIAGADVDGFSTTHDRTHDITFDRCVASGAGGDGYDIGANFSEFPGQQTKFLDVTAIGNRGIGMYVWHSAHIENAWVVNNSQAGIRSARNTTPADRTTSKILILNATVVGNGNRQISLGDRGGYVDAKIFNTIAYSTNNAQSEVLQYKRSDPNVSIAWDWDVLYREGGGEVVVFDTNQSCSAPQVPSCDGSHPNSIGAMPRFKDANWNYLTEGSPGWDQGQRPSLIPQLAGIPIERAETRDHDGNVRPLGAGYEIGAFEGSGGCVAVPGARGGQHLAVLPLLVGILRRARTRLRLVRQGSRPATVRRRCASAVFGALIGPVALCVTAHGQEVRGQEARDPLAEELCADGCFRGDNFIVRLTRGLVLFPAREGLGCFVDNPNCAPPGIGPDICDGLDYRGCELWGATGPGWRGAHLVKDINPGEGWGLGGCPQPIVIDDVMYFVARDGVHGEELWRSDGTTEGTWMVKDVSPGSASGVPGVCADNADGDPSWVALGNVLIFVGFTPEHGYELWRSDGTEQGTWLLRDIWPGPRNGIECGEAAPVVPGFAVLGDKVLFKANDGVTGLEPWVTDGTPEGTRLLKDTVPGSIRVEGVEFLLGAFGDRRRELRRPDDDGCEGIVNGPVFTVRDGLAFFSVEERDTTTGRRVSRTWRTDGTPQGTYRADELRGSSDGGCAIAPGATGAASMFVGFAFLFALRRDHRW